MKRPQTLQLHNHWWCEWTFWVLIALVISAYFINLDRLPFIGEETRRALIAREMVQYDDWIVPRQQGVPRLTKPPLQYWAIALTTNLFDVESRFTVRLTSVLAILLTSIIVYGYARLFLSSNGALAAGLSFATIVDVLHSGRFAQIDALFTCLLSASLLLWHWGYLRQWPCWINWIVAYAFAALATLTKGPQAPVYFMTTVWIYLIYRKDWRCLFSVGHALGVGAFFALLAGWLVPFSTRIGWQAFLALFASEATTRSNVFQSHFLRHLLRFPFEFFLSAFPATLIFPFYCHRNFWRQLEHRRDAALFSLLCIVIAFPTCWLAPGGEARYLMPIYPCLAILVGITVEVLALHCTQWPWLKWMNTNLYRMACGLSCLMGVGLLILTLMGLGEAVGLTSKQENLFNAGGFLLLGWLAWRSAQSATFIPVHFQFCFFLALAYNGIMIPRLEHLCRDMGQEVTQSSLDEITAYELVSLNWVHHRFVYFYPQPIRVLNWPQEWPAVGGYFCFDAEGIPPELPFNWQPIKQIPVDRFKKKGQAKEQVILAKRLPDRISMLEDKHPLEKQPSRKLEVITQSDIK